MPQIYSQSIYQIKFGMSKTDALNNTQQINYQVTINSSAFRYKNSPLRQRMKQKYVPLYWKKMKMDQKTLIPSCEDRLSQLTTSQIDRIIDMEKIRSLLNDKKKKIKQKYIDFDEKDPGKHPNVYQANFLAKINNIAIKRNIKHEKSEGFDDSIGELKQNNGDSKYNTIAYKYIKRYKIDRLQKDRIKTQYVQEDTKSIGSIEDQLQTFQENLQFKKNQIEITKKNKTNRDGYKLIPTKRWFHGMSTHYLDQAKIQKKIQQNPEENYRGYDIQCEIRQRKTDIKYESNYFQTSQTSFYSNKSSRVEIHPDPFGKYKISRIRNCSTNR